VFPGRKDNAQRHCNRIGCDATKIEKIETVNAMQYKCLF
jgi:hypothetical protein